MAYKRKSPMPIIEGGTNAITMATTDGVVYYDGSKLVTTGAGNTNQLLTSNGAGVAPTFQSVAVGGTKTFFYIGGRTNVGAAPLVSTASDAYWSTQYSVQNGTGTASAYNMPISVACTIANLYVNVATNSSSTNSAVTLYKNNSPTALTVAVNAGVTGVLSDTTHTVSVVAGDLIEFKVDQATTGTILGNFSCSFSS